MSILNLDLFKSYSDVNDRVTVSVCYADTGNFSHHTAQDDFSHLLEVSTKVTLEISNDDSQVDVYTYRHHRNDWQGFCLEVRDWLAAVRPDTIVARIYEDGTYLGRIGFQGDPRHKPYWKGTK